MKLAIQGHANRGNEVISYLKMLGGKNPHGCTGLGTLCAYYIIDGNIEIIDIKDLFKRNEYILYSLEGILAIFPYKVGDKVIYEDKKREITKMVWEEQTNTVAYKLDDKLYCNVINELQPYKEEIMETAKITITPQRHWNEDKIELDVAKDYEIKEENGKYYVVKKQFIYPKTYEECCDVLQLEHTFELKDLTIDEEKLTDSFIRLKRCRDAYWKIAGEQMGLDKPWEPDWSTEEVKYVIEIYRNNVRKNSQYYFNTILAFPTAEMRDAFYENFKELIEACKELL